MKIKELIEFVSEKTGHAMGGEEYMTFGDPAKEYSHALVAWTLNDAVVAEAVRVGADLIIHHEELFQPTWYDSSNPRNFLSYPVNTRKVELLTKHHLSSFRIHGSADELCIYNKVVSLLGLEKNLAGSGSWYCEKVFDSPVKTLGELTDLVKKAFRIPHIRAVGNPDAPVRRIGLPWGGMALFVNVSYMEILAEMGADTLICGETDNMGMRFAYDQGINLLETSHELSENDGLADFAELLAKNLNAKFSFMEVPCVWHMA